jgi:hypothetical protein
MLIEKTPNNWRDLENLTAKLFVEIGCKPEVKKIIETARGKIEIDVYIKDFSYAPPLLLICECKYWSKRIPKSVVHSFRTVADDCGANRGYIISKSGFQSGAIEASNNSNIVLVDWIQFQNIFYVRWLQVMTENLYEYADVIFDYMDILADRMNKVNWTRENENRYGILMRQSSIYVLANRWAHTQSHKIIFPLKIQNPTSKTSYTVVLNNYREYFDLALSAAPLLISDWQEFFSR